MEHPLLASSKLVKSFLEDIDSVLEENKQEFEAMTPPKSVSECTTLAGHAEVHIDKSLTDFCCRLSESVPALRQVFKEYVLRCW